MDGIKLPKFLINGLKVNCFQGMNEALPIEEERPFIEKMLLRRFKEVNDEIGTTYNTLDLNDVNYLKTHLSQLFKQVKELEKPIQKELEDLVKDTVTRLFEIPSGMIVFEAKLTDKITPKTKLNIKPQSNDIIKYEYEDTDDMDYLQKEVMKRRMIDAFIQGASYMLSKCYDLYLGKLFSLDKRLPSLYDEIIAINDYLLFHIDDNITDDKIKQGAYVEVYIGRKEDMTKIVSQGLIFPFLLTETIRGLMELFASHGLPIDDKKADYVLKQADFLIAEPWDLRIGKPIWETMIYNDKVKAKITPFFFKNLCELETNEFNHIVKNILSNTKYGKLAFEELLNKSKEEKIKSDFDDKVYDKRNKSVMNDGYYANDELDSLLLDDF